MTNKNLRICPIILVLAVLMGLYVRVESLANLGLAFEEPIHIYAAKSILETGKPILPSGKEYSRALLFTYSVALSFKLFGVSEVSARLPSVIFGTFSIVLVFFIGRRFFGERTGLIAAFLMAFMPFEIVWSRTCRMYSMYQFFFLSAFLAFYNGFEPQTTHRPGITKTNTLSACLGVISNWNLNWFWLLFSGLLLLVAMELHPLVLSFGISVTLYLLCMSIVTITTGGVHHALKTKYLVCLVLLFFIGIVILTLPEVANQMKQLLGFSPSWASTRKASVYRYYDFLISRSLYPIMVFFALGAIQVCTRLNKAGLYTVICAGIPLILHSFITNVQQPRYIFDIFPLFVVVSAYVIHNFLVLESQMYSRIIDTFFIKSKLIKKFRLSIIPFLVLPFFPLFWPSLKALPIARVQGHRLGGPYNVQWEKGCKYLIEHCKPEDVIIASIPLAADFCGCKNIKYSLDNGEIDQFTKSEESRFQLHPFSDTRAIVNLQDLKLVLADNPKGWLIVDEQRFRNSTTVPTEIKEFIIDNLVHELTVSDGTLHIFSWNRNVIHRMLSAS